MAIRREARPGKYEAQSVLTAYFHELSMDGPADQTGSVDEGGWYGLLYGPFDPARDSTEVARHLNSDELAEVAALAGVILYEDTYGFVSVKTFTDPAELASAWAAVVYADRIPRF